MMCAWHLVWIVPLSVFVGFCVAGLFRANGR